MLIKFTYNSPGKFFNRSLTEILTQILFSHFLTDLWKKILFFLNSVLPFSLIYSIFVCFREKKTQISFFPKIVKNQKLSVKLG